MLRGKGIEDNEDAHDKKKGKEKTKEKSKKKQRSNKRSILGFKERPFALNKSEFKFDNPISHMLWTEQFSQIQNYYQSYISYKIYVAKHVNKKTLSLPSGTILLVGKKKTRLVYINLNSECASVMEVAQTDEIRIKFSNEINEIFLPDKEIIEKEKNKENEKLFEKLVLKVISASCKIKPSTELSEASDLTLSELSFIHEIDSNAKNIDFLIELINSLLNVDEKIAINFFNDALIYFSEKNKQFFPVNNPFVNAFLAKKLPSILIKTIIEILKNQALEYILQVPSIVKITEEQDISDQVVIIDREHRIPSSSTCIASEQVYIVASPKKKDSIKYVGFEGLHTCIGVMLINPNTQEMVLAHVSQSVAPLGLIFNIVKDCTRNFQDIPPYFNLRFVGGTVMNKEGERPIRNSNSGRKLKEVIYYLLIAAKYFGFAIRMLSADIFSVLKPYREYRESKTGLCGIDILFDRQGRPLLFECPDLKEYTPYHTGICYSPFVQEIHFFEIWEPLLRTLGMQPTAILKVYDDSELGWNEVFLKEAEDKFKCRFMNILLNKLVIAKLAVNENDPFNKALITSKIDSWHNQWFEAMNEYLSEKEEFIQQFPFTFHLTQYFTILAFRNMQEIMPLSENEVKNSFYSQILANGYLKFLILDTIFLNFAILVENKSDKTIDLDNPTEEQTAIIDLCVRCNISHWHLLDEIKDYQENWAHLEIADIHGEEVNNLVIQMQLLKNLNKVEVVIKAWQDKILEIEVNYIIDEIKTKLAVVQEEIVETIKSVLIDYGIKLLPLTHPFATFQLKYDQKGFPLSREDLIVKLVDIITSHIKWAPVQCCTIGLNVNALNLSVRQFLDNLRVIELRPLLSYGQREAFIENEQDLTKPESSCCNLS